jgi:Flp pilus assembly protein TadB
MDSQTHATTSDILAQKRLVAGIIKQNKHLLFVFLACKNVVVAVVIVVVVLVLVLVLVVVVLLVVIPVVAVVFGATWHSRLQIRQPASTSRV